MKALLACSLALGVLALTGCVSSKYKFVKSATAQPALPLNLASAGSELETTVNAVVFFQGPGSWKRAAYWDEYIVTLANRGTSPLTVMSATVTDFQGEIATLGDNPWELEKQSHRYEKRVLSTVGDVLKIGGATVLTSTAAGGVAVLGALNASSQLGVAMVVGGTVMFAAATVVVPVWSVVANVNSRHDIESEYRRRRLASPLFLVPGQIAQGSFFFRISPGPRQLSLRYQVGGETRDAIVNLAPLASLHLKAPAH